MSRIIVTTMLSVDGYSTGRRDDLLAMPLDASFSVYNAERVRAARGLLLGATTYRQMVNYWPTEAAAETSAADREIAERYAAGLPVTVVSDSLTEAETGPWREQTTIVRRADTVRTVEDLRAGADEAEVVVFGSQTLWTELLRQGLVDELHLMIGPKIVAGDARAFTDVSETELILLGVRRFDGSQAVVLQYGTPAGMEQSGYAIDRAGGPLD